MQPKTENNELHFDLPENARILVVGLGGIGGALLQPLALFLHSLQMFVRLVLVDGDAYEPSNKSRQAFHDLGNKAEVKAAEISNLLGPTDVTVVAVAEYLNSKNIQQIVQPGDYVLLCVDNHESRKLVSGHCQTLPSSTLISGGNEGYDPPNERGTYGNVLIALRRDGNNATVPITHYHPEIAQADGKMPDELGCGQLVQSTPQILFTNFAVASAMLGAFFSTACGQLSYQEVKLDILQARMLPQFPIGGNGG